MLLSDSCQSVVRMERHEPTLCIVDVQKIENRIDCRVIDVTSPKSCGVSSSRSQDCSSGFVK